MLSRPKEYIIRNSKFGATNSIIKFFTSIAIELNRWVSDVEASRAVEAQFPRTWFRIPSRKRVYILTHSWEYAYSCDFVWLIIIHPTWNVLREVCAKCIHHTSHTHELGQENVTQYNYMHIHFWIRSALFPILLSTTKRHRFRFNIK